MTAIALLDLLDGPRSAQLAEKLVQSALDELKRVDEYERQFSWTDSPDEEHQLKLLRSVWQLYDDWARDAEEILDRVKQLHAAGVAVSGKAQLEQAYGQIRARLKITPERILRGRKQAREGQVIPIEDIRRELQARLRR